MSSRLHGAAILLLLAAACVDREVDDKAVEPAAPELSCAERAAKSARQELVAAGHWNTCDHDSECVFAEARAACVESCDRPVLNYDGQHEFTSQIEAANELYGCDTYAEEGCLPAAPTCEPDIRVPVCEAGQCTAIAPAECPSEAPSAVLEAKLIAGGCTGRDCAHVLVLDERAGPCDQVAVTFTDLDDATPNQTVHSRLTPLGRTIARRVASRLEGIQLQTMYPCPSCDDVSGMELKLRRQDIESTHTYDPNAGNVPEELVEVNGFVTSIMWALSRDCFSSDLVEPPAGCR